MTEPTGRQINWVFLSNHAHVLLCIARDPDARTRDIADQVGITERAAQRLVADLIADGYVKRTKNGRRNHYDVNREGSLRHPVLGDLEIGPLLDLLHADGRSERSREAPPRRRDRGGRRSRT
jgi:predicted ArsR family transcriptional regulator